LSAKVISPQSLPNGTVYSRIFATGKTSGQFRFEMRKSVTNVRNNIQFKDGSTTIFTVEFDNAGDILAKGSGTTTVQAYSVDTFFEVIVDLDKTLGANGQFKVSIVGGSSTVFLDVASSYTGVDKLQLDYGGGGDPTGGDFFFDDFKFIGTLGDQVGDGKKAIYYSNLNSFQEAMENAKLWITRNFPVQFNLDAGISAGATSLTVAGDQTGKMKVGDTIDISTSDNLLRERKTIDTIAFTSVTTITWAGGLVNAYGTSDFVERVDILPSISIVNKDASESFQSMVFVKSIVDFTNNEVEDEYSFLTGTPNEDVVVKYELSREDITTDPIAKRTGAVLTI